MTAATRLFFCFFITISVNAIGQNTFLLSREGKPVLERKQLINNCLTSLHKDKKDKTALAICECQIDKLDRHFTNKEFKKFTTSRVIDISGLINQDSILERQIQECFKSSGKTILIQAEGFESEFIADCKESILSNTEKKLDDRALTNFCNCQLSLVKNKKISDAEMKTLSNPNSLLFYEVMVTCGSPYAEGGMNDLGWNTKSEMDITGPATDTISILSLNGMTYVKMKTGTLLQVWLFDTGATDLLINEEMESVLKSENLISEASYLGIGEYEMANGMIDTCRKYLMSNITIGKFTVKNIVVAVTTKGKRIIVGKGLLNKFSSYIINNKNNTLILNR